MMAENNDFWLLDRLCLEKKSHQMAVRITTYVDDVAFSVNHFPLNSKLISGEQLTISRAAVYTNEAQVQTWLAC